MATSDRKVKIGAAFRAPKQKKTHGFSVVRFLFMPSGSYCFHTNIIFELTLFQNINAPMDTST